MCCTHHPSLFHSQTYKAFILPSLKLCCIIVYVQDGGNFPASGPHSWPLKSIRISDNGKPKRESLGVPTLTKKLFSLFFFFSPTFTHFLLTQYYLILLVGMLYQVKNRACYVTSLGQEISVCLNYMIEKGHSSGSSQNRGDSQVHDSFLPIQKKQPAIFKWST